MCARGVQIGGVKNKLIILYGNRAFSSTSLPQRGASVFYPVKQRNFHKRKNLI